MKHWRVALAVLALGTSSAVIAAPANAPNPSFTGGDLFSISVAADPQISPDGRWIAYVRRSNDVMTDKARATIWLIDVATGDERPLVTGAGTHSSPRWSPDGKRLAYASTAEGSSSQLYVRWMDSGQTARITGLARQPSGHCLVTGRAAHRLSHERAGRWGQARIGTRKARRRRMGQAVRDYRQGHLPGRRRRLPAAGIRSYLCGRRVGRRAAAADFRRLS